MNPHIKYGRSDKRGYMLMEVTPKETGPGSWGWMRCGIRRPAAGAGGVQGGGWEGGVEITSVA
jgi:hypothetical protein